jgi:hypothetical protein
MTPEYRNTRPGNLLLLVLGIALVICLGLRVRGIL